jgi:hypothetical protein
VCLCSFSYPAAERMRRITYIVICGLLGSTTFFHIISHGARVSGKKVIEHKVCVLILSTELLEIFLILRLTERDIIIPSHHQIFEKYRNLKFHENLFNGT